MTREEFIAANPLERVMTEAGVKLIGSGNTPKCICPFHDDKNPSMSVNIEKGLFNCHGCGKAGSVIDFIMFKDGKTAAQVLGGNGKVAPFPSRPATPSTPTAEPVIAKTYSYQDELGREVYQVVRMVPKGFRQRHRSATGWVWNMQGIERVLYRLPEVRQSKEVWIVEGEKGADNLASLGFCGTTNVGGSKSWLESYAEEFTGKSVVICGDNDKAGQDHVGAVFESVRNKAANVRIINLPKQFKDVSEFIEGMNDADKSRKALSDMAMDARPHIKGVSVPVYHIADLESLYIRHVKNLSTSALDLGKWLPSLGRSVRHLVPGDFMIVLGGTGVGKTSLLTNLALMCQPMPSLLFEFELPGETVFERTLGTRFSVPGYRLEEAYKTEQVFGYDEIVKKIPALYVCHEASMDPDALETIINRSELRIGERPKVVLLDYIGLMNCKGGSRYERMSIIAESAKQIAKRTQTIIVAASQISRKKEDQSQEVTLCEGKDSGSLENSAGVVLGAWRDQEDETLIYVKVLKNTKGRSGTLIPCNYNLQTLKITERQRSPIDPADVPTETRPTHPDP